MKVLALDYGRARTGLAVSDATGTLARPLGIVRDVGSDAGLRDLLDRIAAEAPDRIVVGLPLTLRGEVGAQAAETLRFVDLLRGRCAVPVDTLDERFTTTLAVRTAGSSRTPDDALAAAHLLEGYLQRFAG
ncbi:MAG: Holliday junction resolvase RuvX [Gaiellales bacterium]